MSRMMRIQLKCPVCSGSFESGILINTSMSGSADLDTRPAAPYRDTMSCWLHKCPHCGYVSGDMSSSASVGSAFLQSRRYLDCDGLAFRSSLAKDFYRHYLIMMECENIPQAISSLMKTAWACDDVKDKTAVQIRMQLVDLIAEYLKTNENESLDIIRMDTLRRSGQFARLVSEYAGRHYTKDSFRDIADFEIDRAIEKDGACYKRADIYQGAERVRKKGAWIHRLLQSFNR